MATLVGAGASLIDKQRIEGILGALHQQRTLSRFCDVVLRVCGEEIFAHSNVLAASSPYFGSFLGQGQDLPRAFSQKTPQVIEIHIDGSDGDSGYGVAVRKVVDFMYTSRIDINMGILTQVMEISKIMQMEPLTLFCETFQNGYRGEKVISSHGNQTNNSVKVDTATSTEHHEYDPANSTSSASKPEIRFGGRGQPKKRGRGRPRKIPKEEESDDDFSAFVSLMAEAEEKAKEDEMAKEAEMAKDAEEMQMVEELTEVKDSDDKTNLEKEEVLNSTGLHRRTRGKRPITTYLTGTRCSARLRSSFRVPCYKSDYIMHPLKRAKRNAVVKPTKESGSHSGEKDHEFKGKQDSLDLMNKSTRRYECDKCDFTTKRVKRLAEHKALHLHADNICSFCEYKAESNEDFQTHMLKHEGPTPFFCKICDAKFKSKTQLNTHLPKHREDKPFACHLCHAGFKWKHALKNHMITHSVTKDHLCDICGFATAHKSQLKAHRLIHTGETFKCDYEGCNFEATKRQNLKYHILTHTHEKPHQCEICGHSFSLIKNMKRHMLLHSDIRPHACQECNFSTTRYDKLKEHMHKQHSVGEAPVKKHRLSDYNEEENADMNTAIMSEETLQTVANIAAVCADENGGETQIFSTVDGVPIVARVQYAEVNSQGYVQYVAQVE